MVEQTSLMAFNNPTIPHSWSRRMVYLAIKKLIEQNIFPCDKEIAEELKWTINRITPRRLELQKKGVIFCKGTKKFNNRLVKIWQLSNK